MSLGRCVESAAFLGKRRLTGAQEILQVLEDGRSQRQFGDVIELARGGDRLVDLDPIPFSVTDILESVRDIVESSARLGAGGVSIGGWSEVSILRERG